MIKKNNEAAEMLENLKKMYEEHKARKEALKTKFLEAQQAIEGIGEECQEMDNEYFQMEDELCDQFQTWKEYHKFLEENDSDYLTNAPGSHWLPSDYQC